MKHLPLIFLSLLAACSSQPVSPESPGFLSRFSIYRIDVNQGNDVAQGMLAQLKPGMSKDQVRYALGTPLLMDIFHADRWDYVYRLQKGNGKLEERKISVFFEQGKLLRVAGDVVPASGAGQVAPAAAQLIDIGAPAASAVAAKPAP